MDNREWMYTGRPSQAGITHEWIEKTEGFLNQAFGKASGGASDTFCPCSECGNRKRKTRRVMGEHLCKYGFMPNYTRWVFHGEARRTRDEVVRPRLEAFDADGGVAGWLGDYHEAAFAEGPTEEGEEEKEDAEEEPEPTAKVFYEMLSSAQKLLHEKATVSQLDAIGRLMGLKSQFNMSRAHFDATLAVIFGLLLQGHILPSSFYES
jgi:hypothetical protein